MKTKAIILFFLLIANTLFIFNNVSNLLYENAEINKFWESQRSEKQIQYILDNKNLEFTIEEDQIVIRSFLNNSNLKIYNPNILSEFDAIFGESLLVNNVVVLDSSCRYSSIEFFYQNNIPLTDSPSNYKLCLESL